MIQFRFSLQFFYVMYPNFSWEIQDIVNESEDNEDGSENNEEDRIENMVGTDMKSLKPGEESIFVRVSETNRLKSDGKWTYDIWKVKVPETRQVHLWDYVADVEPYITMEGYFGIWSKNAEDFLAGKEFGTRPVVVAIVGESGSGKTSLSLELEKRHSIPTIVSYTTRPMREGEVNGKEHWFVAEKDMPDKSEMLAYTYFGNNHYWTEKKDLNHPVVTYVIDEQGVLDLYELKKTDEIDVIYVYVKRAENPTDEERKERDVCRAEAQEKLKKLDIEPHIYIINDYPDAESFLKTEADNLGNTLKFITGNDQKL